jgi:hypothetical protein
VAAGSAATARESFPAAGTLVNTKKGSGTLERVDIFAKEAVVLGSDNTQFRVTPDEIMWSDDKRLGTSRTRTETSQAADEGLDEAERDVEALRKLDEPDT